MKKLLIATKNQGKIKEFRKFLSGLPIDTLSLSDAGIFEDIEEDGKTYEENSKKKAIFYAKISCLPALADDGGIEIAALNGAPGVKSRRWLGFEASDETLISHIKKVIEKLPKGKERAVFKTVVSFALPSGLVWSSEEKVNGILRNGEGMKILDGYPYRSFFYLPEINKFYHDDELTSEEERLYNHRYKATNKLKSIIIKELEL